jgi:transposase-like protein
MDLSERKQVVEALQSIIYENMYDIATSDDVSSVECCPRCGSMSFVRKGKDASGNQRYFCKDCARTFGSKTNKVLGSSKLDVQVWMRYLECFVDALPLRTCAERSGVSLKTAFYMRHRILECIARFCPSFQVEAGCGAELDEVFFRENFKGNHTKSDFGLPRHSRKRGGQNHTRGLSKQQICVMTGINDSGGMFYELTGRGLLSKERADTVLKNKIGTGAIISTDKAHAYRKALKELDIAAHMAYGSRDRSEGTINRVNTLHSQIAGFMYRFKGVSTKHLSSYLAWFKWQQSFSRGNAKDVMDILAKQLNAGVSHLRISDYKEIPSPYMEYWDRAA